MHPYLITDCLNKYTQCNIAIAIAIAIYIHSNNTSSLPSVRVKPSTVTNKGNKHNNTDK